jgi:chromosome segregation ATPase
MEGKDLDEFNAHRFLEKVQETKTVKELREQLKAIDLDFNKRMAMLEYLLFRYKKGVAEFVARPQGDNTKELEKAEAMLAEVQQAFDEATRTADEAKKSAEIARKRAEEAAAAAAEAAARAAEAAARAAEAAAAADEQRAALAEVQSQEDARNNKTKELTAKSEDQSIGLVTRNKAKNELAQHLAEDPLPLRKAKITLEAANRKAEKAKAAADAAKAQADNAKAQADSSKAQADAAHADAENDAAAAEAAVADAEKKVQAAEAYLAEVKAASGGSGQGSVWWLERELAEKKKFMPKSRGGTW